MDLISHDMLDQVVQSVISLRSELALFVVAFALHHVLFGNVFPRSSKQSEHPGKGVNPGGAGKRSPLKVHNSDVDNFNNIKDDGNFAHTKKAPTQIAFERGDHQMVLRYWKSLKQSNAVLAEQLAQVVESMQRLKKDGDLIVEEVCSFIAEHKHLCTISYINNFLAILAKSLDAEVVLGIVESLPSLGMEANSITYESIAQMHFSTRSFDKMTGLQAELRAKCIIPTTRTSLMLLKTTLHTGNLGEALRCFKEVSAASGNSLTASSAPQHMAAQLVELACREKSLKVVLPALEAKQMPCTVEMLNIMLSDCEQSKDYALAERVERLGLHVGTEYNSHTFYLLMKMAGTDVKKISKYLEEMTACNVESSPEVVGVVLSACTLAGDTLLADKLYKSICTGKIPQLKALSALIRFYTEAGCHIQACDIYEKHLQVQTDNSERRRALLDARTERSLISAALACGRDTLAKTFLEASPSETAMHISMIRSAGRKGNAQEAFDLVSALEQSGADLTSSLYNSLLDACVECGEYRRAEELMQSMEAKGMADAVSYNTMIKSYLRHSNFNRARSFMDEMRQAGHFPNHVTYNELIHAVVRGEKELQRMNVWDIVEEMKANGVHPNKVTCSILLKSLKAKSHQTDIAKTMDLTDSMEEPMDEVLLSSVLEACVRIGKPSLLVQKLEQYHGKNNISITGAHTFGSLIKAYGQAKDIMGVWRCWKEMRCQHIRPTSITIGCMVEAVVSNDDVDGGYELVMQLLEDPLCKEQVNAVVFGSVIKGYGRTKHVERVWAVFEEMLTRGIVPSVVTYNAVIDACARNGCMDAVPKLLNDMKKQGLEANLITHSTVIKGHCQRGDMTAALATLDEMRQKAHLKPDEIVYNTLLDGCAQSGLASEAERLLHDMQKQGVRPNNFSLTVVVRLMSQARRMHRAFELVDSITKKYNFRASMHVCNALMQGCITARDLPRAVAVFDQMVHDHLQLDSRTCQHLIHATLGGGEFALAIKLLNAMLGLTHDGDRQERHTVSVQFDETFLKEVFSTLIDAGGETESQARQLMAKLRSSHHNSQIDPCLLQRSPWRNDRSRRS